MYQLVLVLIFSLLAAPTVSAFPLVVDGKAGAVIVIPAGSSIARLESAHLLQEYVRRSTGAILPIQNEREAGPALLLGRSPALDRLGLRLESLDDDGFVLRGIDANTYVVAGPTESGTEFGIDELLERYVGVRWLLPGDSGTDIPRHATLDLPAKEVRQEPVYFSRQLSGLPNALQSAWARRNRMHGRVSFHHNLLHLFPPSRYATTHPEFYPFIKGQRYIPVSDEDPNWQPNLTAPGIVSEAVKNIKEYFHTHPDVTSYSLGMNDSSRWDESPVSLARESGRRNFLGFRDVSDSYYMWCNDVVAEVLKEYPDKWFGVLAYDNVAEPPLHVKLNPRIVPYLTYDRMKWIKPELESQGHSLTRRWLAMSSIIGWYDYVYGSPYCVPRVYPHEMAAYLRYGGDVGVRANYAELYPNWGEGPKAYVYLKLQWNPHADVDSLLDEWYSRCVGRAAAPMLKKYYAIWEAFWTRKAPRSKWWTDQGIYLRFDSPAYLAAVDEVDVRRSRQLLDAVVAKAETPEQRTRAKLLRDAFAYYEASAIAFGVERPHALRTPEGALASVTATLERIKMALRRVELEKSFATDPVLIHPVTIDRYPELRGVAFGFGRRGD
jgi:Domain of unknown function (DUF4838)